MSAVPKTIGDVTNAVPTDRSITVPIKARNKQLGEANRELVNAEMLVPVFLSPYKVAIAQTLD